MLVFILLRELFADYGTIYLMLMGAIAIAVMLKAPMGIWAGSSNATTCSCSRSVAVWRSRQSGSPPSR